MTRLKQLKGFTLIELIVVVIIIGILAAIAAVAYNKFVSQARTTAAEADGKQVVTALSAYGQQNDEKAEAAITDLNAQVAADASGATTFNGLAGITGDVFVGPEDTTAQTVTVYAGKDDTASHSCTLDVSGELPVLGACS